MEVREGQATQQQLSQKEIPLKNGEVIKLPTIHVSRMILYHGSPVADIAVLEEGDQQSIGKGIYLASQRETAKGYAKKRSGAKGSSAVYEVEISDMDIADLRTREAQEQFAKLYKQSLLDWEQNILPYLKGPSEEITKVIKEQRKEAVVDLVKKIDTNSFSHLRDLTFGWEELVSKTLHDVGYKGLMSLEGEPPHVDFHDSVVIFNPRDAKIISQQLAA